jgi:hypothetical protein
MKSNKSSVSTIPYAFRASKYDGERFKAQAFQQGMNFSEYVREALINFERYSSTEHSIKKLEQRLFRRLFKLNAAIAGLTDEELIEAQTRYKELLNSNKEEK